MSAHDGAEPTRSSGEARRLRLLTLLLDDDAIGTRVVAAADSIRPAAEGPAPRPPTNSGIQARLQRLCEVAVSEVGVDGAGVTVMSSADTGLDDHRDQLAATGPLTRRLEDLQLTAGEGPCLDAHRSGTPVLAPDITTETTRWFGFAPEAISAGAAALFSLPLQVGAVRLGTLDLHRGTAGRLTRAQLADALTLAALATETLLELAAILEPDADANVDPAVVPASGVHGLDAGWLPDVHAEVHLASGMVSAQLDIDVSAALLRIRAHAFASGEPIHDVARRIVARDLVLDHLVPPPRTDTDTDTDTDTGWPPGPDSSREDD